MKSSESCMQQYLRLNLSVATPFSGQFTFAPAIFTYSRLSRPIGGLQTSHFNLLNYKLSD